MDEESASKKRTVDYFLKRGMLVSPDFLDPLQNPLQAQGNYQSILDKAQSKDLLVLNNDMASLLDNASQKDINWFDLEKSRALLEKGKGSAIYKRFIDYMAEAKAIASMPEPEVKVVFSYQETVKKRDFQDFVRFFNARYRSIEKILRTRQELGNILSINRVINKKDKEHISIIGIVKDKAITKNKNVMLTLEDPSGQIKVLVNKNKPELYEQARSIVNDETIAVIGVNGDNIIFANNILWPDVPFNRELKKHPEEMYAIFLSDLHIGSKQFLPEDFNRFIKWINGELGNEAQREIAKKTRYAFIAGDLIDGCGIYPDQDKELLIKDVYAQYEECANLLKQIPKRIKIIICPGNHDAMRLAEPQPPLYKDFAKSLYELPNAIFVSNPAIINIGASSSFPGFDVLMYHGYSFDYFVANVDSIRQQGGYDRGDLIMRFLLQRRHLAPTHTSTLYMPDPNIDSLVIEKIPDFFISGHIHKSIAANYRNITMICGSCWQSKTSFQEKVGHNPEPGRVPIVNLKTREVKIMRFVK